MGPRKSKDCSSAARRAVPEEQPCQMGRTSPLRDEFALPAVASWALLLRVKSEAISTRMRDLAENMLEIGHDNSHAVLGMSGGGLTLKLRRRQHVAPGASLTRSSFRGGRDPRGGGLHVPQL